MFHGDNLDFMRAMDSETVDLIATDPPFNKGKDFHATPDSIAADASFQDRWVWEPVHDEWLGGVIKDDNQQLAEAIMATRHAHGESMGAFICFLSVRMMSMHRLLKRTGSIFLHCDATASHYIKSAMDAIFGRENFVNEIIWCYETSGRSKKAFGRKHDTIFWYAKKAGQHTYTNPRVPVSEASLKKYFKHVDEDGRRYREDKKAGRAYRYYADAGQNPLDWWTDVAALQHNAKERTGYPTQKPLALYKRLIEAASNPGDVVLDPFAGCATTCVAAEILGRQWVGIDIWDQVAEVVKERVEKEQIQLLKKEILLIKELPQRTDSGETASPYLRVRVTIKEPKDEYRTREAKVAHLIKQFGLVCQGCGREFDDKAYLQLDHMLPRADGGPNHISNRCLLCPPCNIRKSNKLTLSGLRAENKIIGFMHNEERLAIMR